MRPTKQHEERTPPLPAHASHPRKTHSLQQGRVYEGVHTPASAGLQRLRHEGDEEVDGYTGDGGVAGGVAQVLLLFGFVGTSFFALV